jgi:hypothetical protein
VSSIDDGNSAPDEGQVSESSIETALSGEATVDSMRTGSPVQEETVDSSVSKRATAKEITYRRLGWRIFLTVVGLIGLMLTAVVLFAFFTYPTKGDVQSLLGKDSSSLEALQQWRDTQNEWVSHVTTIAQLAVFGSIVPVLATVVGYLLGEQRNSDV